MRRDRRVKLAADGRIRSAQPLRPRIKTRRRLVEDQQRRVVRQSHGDDDTLLHPAAELVRIALRDSAAPGMRTRSNISTAAANA